MFSYTWDSETGGLLLNSKPLESSKEPRPVYSSELDLLGFDQYFKYEKDDSRPYMWAEANVYIYRGKEIAKINGGSLFTAPSLTILDSSEVKDKVLHFVDIDQMIVKNEEILGGLVKDTIKRIYNVYIKYKENVEIFHVSYSGGKDSEVTLDLVSKSLPHDEFVVVFGDTGMEFCDTYNSVDKAELNCKKTGIKFYRAKSHMTPLDSWKTFGPPASALRWCHSVHKTTPQLLLLRKILGKTNFSEMAFVGVRAFESQRRSKYDFVSCGTKHKGQWSCNPILEWNSAEVYLYIYSNNLNLNNAYRKGLGRAGCVVCPMASKKSDYVNSSCYSEAKAYYKIVSDLYANANGNDDKRKSYMENTGWKARKNGRDLTIAKNDYDERSDKDSLIITFKDPSQIWKTWASSLGNLIEIGSGNKFVIETKEKEYIFKVISEKEDYFKAILPLTLYKNDVVFVKGFRRIFRKSHYCIACRVCEANCMNGSLTFDEEGKPIISETCSHCGECLETDDGCLMYKSLWVSKGRGKMKNKSLDCYATHAPKIEWFSEFLKFEENFDSKNSLGNNQIPMFKRFLRDSGVIRDDKDTKIASIMRREGLESENLWALMFVNLSYSPQVGWFVETFGFNEKIMRNYMKTLLADTDGVSKSGENSIPNSIKRIANLPLSKVGFASLLKVPRKDGFAVIRNPWFNPTPEVILYSLYKYAEACGDYYQFSLSRLYDKTVDSDGVSPAKIFGVEIDEMKQILNGLSTNYPEFINASFTFDLDNITLQDDKTAEDVLDLL